VEHCLPLLLCYHNIVVACSKTCPRYLQHVSAQVTNPGCQGPQAKAGQDHHKKSSGFHSCRHTSGTVTNGTPHMLLQAWTYKTLAAMR
jgi:hypothetical protein